MRALELMVAVSVLAASGCTRRVAPPPPSKGDGASATAAATKSKSKSKLRLLTYNLYVYNEDIEATAKLIRTIDADVVALQETIPAFEVALRGALSDVYPHMTFHVGPIGNGPGMMSKLPWSSSRYVPSKVGFNGFWIGAFALDGRRVQLVNAHLHPSPIAGWNPFAAAAAYREGERVRVAQVDELAAVLSPGSAVVLGDFNSLAGSTTLEHFRSLGFTDGLAGSAAASAPTFRFGGIGVHVDHVVVTSEVTCSESAVLSKGTSDHFPLVTTIEWSPPS